MRTAAPDDAAAIALELLHHSLRLGHRRLSVARLEMAATLHAGVTEGNFRRCLALVQKIDDAALQQRVINVGRYLGYL